MKKVLFILSTSYAGSHFLSLLLGSHSRTLHIGEVSRLGTDKFEVSELDWTAGGVFNGLGKKDLPDIHQTVFSRSHPSPEVLIDTSKTIQWAESFSHDNRHQKKYLHLIRDPRALVRRYGLQSTPESRRKIRWKLACKFPALAFSIWQAPETDLWMYQWLLQNQKITNFIRKNNFDSELVTYRDLATDQAGEITRLMRWLDLEYEPGQLEYWNRPHIGSQKRNYDWVKEKKTQHFDLRWQTELSPETQRRITENSRVRAYLADLKLKFIPDGLTHADK
ncbi:MAG TPA: hypothetical protein VK742_20675 [Candidatus Sulfotelmatobacter sp.]|nr:hypothetical protein [Candidatus Sulfotelmatobacter sp.]